jgi:hypothetical protein
LNVRCIHRVYLKLKLGEKSFDRINGLISKLRANPFIKPTVPQPGILTGDIFEQNLCKSFFHKNLNFALSYELEMAISGDIEAYFVSSNHISNQRILGERGSAIVCADAEDVSKESLADWMEKYKSVIGDDAPFSSEASSDFWNWYKAIFI